MNFHQDPRLVVALLSDRRPVFVFMVHLLLLLTYKSRQQSHSRETLQPRNPPQQQEKRPPQSCEPIG